MTMNYLPPQAYTKETLVHAYNWLQTQPQKIKELAVSQDVLVSLYTKAKLHGEGIFEKPSFQNFRNDLKTIANMIGDFDSPPHQRPSAHASHAPQATTHNVHGSKNSNSNSNTNYAPTPKASAAHSHQVPQQIEIPLSFSSPTVQSSAINHQPTLINTSTSAPVQQSSPPKELKTQDSIPLDPKSLAMIREVQNNFNLSTETEAIRLLISVGFQKIRSQF